LRRKSQETHTLAKLYNERAAWLNNAHKN